MSGELAYGLMGAAQGFLEGLYSEWKQNQQDIHTQKLLHAKFLQDQRIQQIAHQNRTAENVAKVAAQFTNRQTLQTQSETAASKLDAKRIAAQQASDRRDNATRTAIAKLRVGAQSAPSGPKSKLAAVRRADGSTVIRALKPGDIIAKGNELASLSGQPPMYPAMGGPWSNFGLNGGPSGGNAPPPPAAPAATTAPRAQPLAPGSAFRPVGQSPGQTPDNPLPIGGNNGFFTHQAPPVGTWIKLPSGEVMQYHGSKAR